MMLPQVSVTVFVTYVYSSEDHYLAPSTAFVALSLIAILKESMGRVPDIISHFVKVGIPCTAVLSLAALSPHDLLIKRSLLDSSCKRRDIHLVCGGIIFKRTDKQTNNTQQQKTHHTQTQRERERVCLFRLFHCLTSS